jgi:signal-transduction protein with cAMP-binding, CBS, and nucleotidyltransferase domain
MQNLNVGDFVENAAVVPHDAAISQAVEKMIAHQSDRVYLTDETGSVTRVICDYTLFKAIVRGDLASCSLNQLASPLQNCLKPSQPLSQAAVLFRNGSMREIAVFESHQFLGVLKRQTLLAQFIENEEKIAQPPQFPTIDHDARTSQSSTLSGFDHPPTRKIG